MDDGATWLAMSWRLGRELLNYVVVVAPVEQRDAGLEAATGDRGSGVCVRIGGRFFVATAAHVVPGAPATRYAVLTPVTGDGVLRVIGAGSRGGRRHDRHDVAWLELHPRAAADSGRKFLELERIAPYRNGEGDQLWVVGSPAHDFDRGTRDGRDSYTANASAWPTRSASDGLAESERADRLLVAWPEKIPGYGHDIERYPEPRGISGGGVWASNAQFHGEAWRPETMQLVAIEFATYGERNARRLVCQQIHVWLEMLAEDIPELADVIRTHLRGASVKW
jgi:hypothetical protein